MIHAGLLFLRIGVAGLLIPLHGWNRLVVAYEHVLFGEAWGFVQVVERLGFPLPLVLRCYPRLPSRSPRR